MNEKLKPIREQIIARYGMDINDAKCAFSTFNYLFIFENYPYVIRVTLGQRRSHKELLSEYMWLDDLKQFSSSICDPQLSLNNKPVEEFYVNDVCYKATMFRCAKGTTKTVSELEPIHIINVGEFLGRIHAGSIDGAKAGFVYKRDSYLATIEKFLEKVRKDLPPEILARIETTFQKVRELPEDSNCFGMIHGDFHMNNFFLDGNNVWTFDFDDCAYGFFLYDIASVCLSWLMFGYHCCGGRTARAILEQDILPYIKMGYELHMQFPKEHWDLLSLFFELRFCSATIALFHVDEIGSLPDLELGRQFMSFPLTQPDVLAGLDILLKSETDYLDSGN